MTFIDPRTFLLVANLLGVMCALVLWVQARSFPPDIKGLREWAVAIVLIGGASGLSSMRGILPDILGIILASAMTLAGELMLVVGLLRYRDRPAVWKPALNGIGSLMLLMLWLTYGSQSYQGRIFLMSLAHIGFFAAGAWLVWGASPRGFASRFLFALFAGGVLVAAYRLATLTVEAGVDADLYDHNLAQQAYLATFSLGALFLSIGFILLTNERLRVELEFMATRDPMTGLFNRRAFFNRAAIEWARSTRAGKPLAVITADIDFFKKVNDTHGHHIGDLVIKDFGTRAAGLLRLPDTLARFGGEEFVFLLPDTPLAEAKKVAERIRREIETRSSPGLPAYTASFGVAEANGKPGSAADIEALIAEADAALYRAKQGGRNRVAT